MPAMLDDPTAPPIYRVSGASPFPDPQEDHPSLPFDIVPRQVTLRDRVTIATIVPFSSRHQVPSSLLLYLSDQFKKEIELGDTYPMMNGLPDDKFASYWFQNFGAVMILGNIESADEISADQDWATQCLGSFYIKPNYPGRSSHVCNAGFLVTEAARNKGVGRLLGEQYIEWAPKLGYVYSVFNLVYETNVASCRIWDALGFKRIGRVKGAGNLKSYPGQLVDAIIYGRDLGPEGEDFVSEERFDKIKFYLKYGKYPAGADRAEKSRLRSAATHYKLIPESDKLMLKDKEVISDPQRQYEIARNVHVLQHGGINKTTATIAEKYHWVRIKETVSLVIRNCTKCKELGKTPPVRPAEPLVNRPPPPVPDPVPSPTFKAGQGSVSPQVLNRALPPSQRRTYHEPHQTQAPIAKMSRDAYMPIDPQMMDPQLMDDVRHDLGTYHHHENSYQQEESFQALLDRHKDGERGGGTEGEGMGDELDMLIDEEEGEGMGERQRYQGDDGDSEAEDGEVGRQLRHEGTRELRGRRNGFGDGG
ncbi:Acyl-CoA N-acyltransferases (Nat) [Glarea lozoyensis ATCC 20868]|uniref:Acyl-CoA N-acyltransferases (Nat) n=1 Tax=Glarea lozoyensis (strain ATCC 20868 / MF5171) TaxID=1116229 RepID=S3DUS9_GLAL2|nr:Acyl-CoA N-acyltransferases (Nat) [Glarea lozoyensis ATCC 20868]EPE35706.1 Acyl-CoA N-acyltransferases (Nat) [Glarea lozoyensis ATCC 20868]